MKRIITMTITLCLLLCLTACSCSSCKSTPPTSEASYFLSNYKNKGIEEVEEVAVYTIKYKNNGEQASNGIKPNATGTFTTTLTNTTSTDAGIVFDEAIDCYKFTMDYELDGSYEYKEQSYKFTDKIVSTVWFLGVKDNLKPLKVERSVVCTTPYLEYTANQNNDIQFLKFDFDYSIDYVTNDAKMQIVDNSVDKNLKKDAETTIKNYFSNTFVENELLYFYPRAFKLNSSFSTTRQVITIDGKMDLNMKVSSFNSDLLCSEVKDVDNNVIADNRINGKTQTVKVDVVQYTNTGKYQSAPISVYLANVNDTNNLFRVPVKIETFVTLVGGFEYNLVEFSHN